MWLLKWNVLFKISLLHFPLSIYLHIYEIILQIWPNLTLHFCSSGNGEMCYWSKSGVQDPLGSVCQARRRQSRNRKHMVYKWILCYLMRGEEWKIIHLSGMSGLPCWWLNMQHFWWMKIGWKKSLCHLLKGPYGQEAKEAICPVPRSPGSQFTTLWCILVHRRSQPPLFSDPCASPAYGGWWWMTVRSHEVSS